MLKLSSGHKITLQEKIIQMQNVISVGGRSVVESRTRLALCWEEASLLCNARHWVSELSD